MFVGVLGLLFEFSLRTHRPLRTPVPVTSLLRRWSWPPLYRKKRHCQVTLLSACCSSLP